MARRRSATPALQVLVDAGVEHVVREYDHDPTVSDFGIEAADKLNEDPQRVFKTLMADTGSGLVVGIVPVTKRLDCRALARAVGVKSVRLADPKRAERSSGYVVGGISPLGQRTRVQTVLDESAENFNTILVSAGRRGLDVELSHRDLVLLLDATVAPIAM